MKYQNATIDLETLDTETTAKILSIGIVPFNWGEQVSFEELCKRPSSKYIKIDMNSYLVEHGLFTTSISTENWWNNQGEEARHVLETSIYDLPIRDALHSLKQHLAEHVEPLKKDQGQIFCRGYDFDGGILDHAFQQCGITQPWQYNRFRCIRQLLTH